MLISKRTSSSIISPKKLSNYLLILHKIHKKNFNLSSVFNICSERFQFSFDFYLPNKNNALVLMIKCCSIESYSFRAIQWIERNMLVAHRMEKYRKMRSEHHHHSLDYIFIFDDEMYVIARCTVIQFSKAFFIHLKNWCPRNHFCLILAECSHCNFVLSYVGKVFLICCCTYCTSKWFMVWK